MNGREARESGLRLKAWGCARSGGSGNKLRKREFDRESLVARGAEIKQTVRKLAIAVKIASQRAVSRNFSGSDRPEPAKIRLKFPLEIRRTEFSHGLKEFYTTRNGPSKTAQSRFTRLSVISSGLFHIFKLLSPFASERR